MRPSGRFVVASLRVEQFPGRGVLLLVDQPQRRHAPPLIRIIERGGKFGCARFREQLRLYVLIVGWHDAIEPAAILAARKIELPS